MHLAYSMKTDLIQRKQSYEDIWMECLGDLERYRMAIEDKCQEHHQLWTEFIRHWYSEPSGRLQLQLAEEVEGLYAGLEEAHRPRPNLAVHHSQSNHATLLRRHKQLNEDGNELLLLYLNTAPVSHHPPSYPALGVKSIEPYLIPPSNRQRFTWPQTTGHHPQRNHYHQAHSLLSPKHHSRIGGFYHHLAILALHTATLLLSLLRHISHISHLSPTFLQYSTPKHSLPPLCLRPTIGSA